MTSHNRLWARAEDVMQIVGCAVAREQVLAILMSSSNRCGSRSPCRHVPQYLWRLMSHQWLLCPDVTLVVSGTDTRNSLYFYATFCLSRCLGVLDYTGGCADMMAYNNVPLAAIMGCPSPIVAWTGPGVGILYWEQRWSWCLADVSSRSARMLCRLVVDESRVMERMEPGLWAANKSWIIFIDSMEQNLFVWRVPQGPSAEGNEEENVLHSSTYRLQDLLPPGQLKKVGKPQIGRGKDIDKLTVVLESSPKVHKFRANQLTQVHVVQINLRETFRTASLTVTESKSKPIRTGASLSAFWTIDNRCLVPIQDSKSDTVSLHWMDSSEPRLRNLAGSISRVDDSHFLLQHEDNFSVYDVNNLDSGPTFRSCFCPQFFAGDGFFAERLLRTEGSNVIIRDADTNMIIMELSGPVFLVPPLHTL